MPVTRQKARKQPLTETSGGIQYVIDDQTLCARAVALHEMANNCAHDSAAEIDGPYILILTGLMARHVNTVWFKQRRDPLHKVGLIDMEAQTNLGLVSHISLGQVQADEITPLFRQRQLRRK